MDFYKILCAPHSEQHYLNAALAMQESTYLPQYRLVRARWYWNKKSLQLFVAGFQALMLLVTVEGFEPSTA